METRSTKLAGLRKVRGCQSRQGSSSATATKAGQQTANLVDVSGRGLVEVSVQRTKVTAAAIESTLYFGFQRTKAGD